MNHKHLRELADTSSLDLWMWIWFGASAIAVGILFGNVFATTEDGLFSSGGPEFNVGAMFGGFIVGAISNIPGMAIFHIIKKILHSQHAIQVPPEVKPTR